MEMCPAGDNFSSRGTTQGEAEYVCLDCYIRGPTKPLFDHLDENFEGGTVKKKGNRIQYFISSQLADMIDAFPDRMWIVGTACTTSGEAGNSARLLPSLPTDLAALAGIASQAQCGKGEETVTDTTVRDTLKLDLARGGYSVT